MRPVPAIFILLSFLLTVGASAHTTAAGAVSEPIALERGLGTLHHPVSTGNAQAQAYFDQGLKLIFAFNHEAAIRSFQRAVELDSGLAMAHWGIALALGPNINQPMSPDAQKVAYTETQKALALKSKASVAERAYIDALAKRYGAKPDADRQPLETAYMNAMKSLARAYPNDTDAAVLYAESLMNLHTTDASMQEAANVLERAMAQRPDHIGANHYYIHVMEGSRHPEKALPAAERLEKLAPAAGHLLHMSAHIYIRTGDYPRAAHASKAAVRADEALAKPEEATFYSVAYYGHNLHFLAVTNALAGNSMRAIAAAKKLYVHSERWTKETTQLDFFMVTPAMVLIQFGRWDDILALPRPPAEVPLTVVIWHFARTLALVAKSQTTDAMSEGAKFARAVNDLPKNIPFGNNTSGAVVALAQRYLEGRGALLRGDLPSSIGWLREAVIAEDALVQDDPPAWYLSSRQALGAALMRARDFSAAEKVYREDLERNPENGPGLYGLQAAIAAQGRTGEATALQKRIARAWRAADMKPGLGI
jgi:tetratricopeptide (TPR) repeat protein